MPEYVDDSGNNATEWFFRLNELHNVCIQRGFLPNYAVTEYGYSPTSATEPTLKTNFFAPKKPLYSYDASTYPYIEASAETQAIYYLRTVLMDSSMRPFDGSQNPLNGIGWEYNLYFSHPRNVPEQYWATDWEDQIYKQWIQDWAFHQHDWGAGLVYPGDSRAVRSVARELFDPANSIKLSGENTKIWIPLGRKKTGYPDYYNWCGWETGSGQKWAAIWRYDDDIQKVQFYYRPAGAVRPLVLNGNYSGYTVNVWKFGNFTSTSASFIDQQVTINVTANDYDSGTNKTTINIPGVTDNPLFLKFNH